MPEMTVNLSQREAELVEQYAEKNGVEPAEVIKEMYLSNISQRLRFRRKAGEVRTFRLLKRG